MNFKYGKFKKDDVYTLLFGSGEQVVLPNDDDLFLTNLVELDNPEIVSKYGVFVEFVYGFVDLTQVTVVTDMDTLFQYKEKK